MLQLRSRAPWRCSSCIPELPGDTPVAFQSSLEMLQWPTKTAWLPVSLQGSQACGDVACLPVGVTGVRELMARFPLCDEGLVVECAVEVKSDMLHSDVERGVAIVRNFMRGLLCVCVFVCVREREKVCEREKESMCIMCFCAEEGRQCESVIVCVCCVCGNLNISIHMCVLACLWLLLLHC